MYHPLVVQQDKNEKKGSSNIYFLLQIVQMAFWNCPIIPITSLSAPFAQCQARISLETNNKTLQLRSWAATGPQGPDNHYCDGQKSKSIPLWSKDQDRVPNSLAALFSRGVWISWTLGCPPGAPNYFVILNMGQGTRVAGIYYEPPGLWARIQNTGDHWLNPQISKNNAIMSLASLSL